MVGFCDVERRLVNGVVAIQRFVTPENWMGATGPDWYLA
jgi:hypothetical protein